MDGDAVLKQGIDEFRGGREIGLIRRDDVAARVAHGWIVEDGGVKLGGNRDGAGVEQQFGGDLGVDRSRLLRCGLLLLDAGRFQGFDPLGAHGPGVFAAVFNGVAAHAVDIEQEVFAVLGRQIQHGAVGGHGVLNRLAEVPGLGRHGKRQVAGGELAVGD